MRLSGCIAITTPHCFRFSAQCFHLGCISCFVHSAVGNTYVSSTTLRKSQIAPAKCSRDGDKGRKQLLFHIFHSARWSSCYKVQHLHYLVWCCMWYCQWLNGVSAGPSGCFSQRLFHWHVLVLYRSSRKTLHSSKVDTIRSRKVVVSFFKAFCKTFLRLV